MDLKKIQRELKKRNLSEVMKDTRISYPTIHNIANGGGQDSKYSTLLLLHNYLFGGTK